MSSMLAGAVCMACGSGFASVQCGPVVVQLGRRRNRDILWFDGVKVWER